LGGTGHGDPGNWNVNGTNGPNFLGFNGFGGYSEVVTFTSGVNSVSLDFSRSNGSTNATITLQAFNGDTLLGSTTAELGSINTWSTLSLSFPSITSISWAGFGSGAHYYGVDNFTFSAAAIPEPESYAMLLAGLALLGFMARRRK
jgi:hypothetical protein